MHMNIIKLFGICVLLNSGEHLFNAYEISLQNYLIIIIPTKTAAMNLFPAKFKFPQQYNNQDTTKFPTESVFPS